MYSEGRCGFAMLKLSGNSRITGVSVGKLGQSLHHFPNIKKICLHDLQLSEAGVNRIVELIGITCLT